MKNILYIIAVIMIIAWAIGFFAFTLGAIIHVLLVLAVVAIIFEIFSRNKSV